MFSFFYFRRQGLPFQDLSIRPFHRPLCLHQVYGSGCCLSPSSWSAHLRTLAPGCPLWAQTERDVRFTLQTLQYLGLRINYKNIQPLTLQMHQLHRLNPKLLHGQGLPPLRALTQDGSLGPSVSLRHECPPFRPKNFWDSDKATESLPRTRCPTSVVGRPCQWFLRPPFPSPSPKGTTYHGGQPHRWGAHCAGLHFHSRWAPSDRDNVISTSWNYSQSSTLSGRFFPSCTGTWCWWPRTT